MLAAVRTVGAWIILAVIVGWFLWHFGLGILLGVGGAVLFIYSLLGVDALWRKIKKALRRGATRTTP